MGLPASAPQLHLGLDLSVFRGVKETKKNKAKKMAGERGKWRIGSKSTPSPSEIFFCYVPLLTEQKKNGRPSS